MSRRHRRVYAKHPIDRLAIFEHHNWTCVLCGGMIDREARFPSLDAATIEHIVPLSLGGRHEWNNVAPAHARCNFNKGNKLLEDLNGT